MPSRQTLDVGDEQVVADELALRAGQFGQHLPAVPVVLRHAVFDRRDGVIGDQLGEIFGLLLRAQGFASAFIHIGALLEELGRGAIEAEIDVPARLEARLLDGFHDEIQRRLGARQVRREAALVAHVGVVAGILEGLLEGVEDLGAHAHRLGEAVGADGEDHEFLEIDGIVGVRPAIDDVHHRHRKHARLRSAHIAIERQGRGIGRGRFAEVVGAMPEVMEFYRMAGDVDYMLRVVVPTSRITTRSTRG